MLRNRQATESLSSLSLSLTVKDDAESQVTSQVEGAPSSAANTRAGGIFTCTGRVCISPMVDGLLRRLCRTSGQ